MNIKSLEVKNFKSFKELTINLGKFNVLIGANASGKSNFVSIFKFLRDITKSGLNNAISLQGGTEYLRNMNIGTNENLNFKITANAKYIINLKRTKQGLIGLRAHEIIYEFALKFYKKKREPGFKIVKDTLTQKIEFLKLEKKANEITIKEKLGTGEISISNNNGNVKIDFKKPSKIKITKKDIFPLLRNNNFQEHIEKKPLKHTLLLETHFFMLSLLPLPFELEKIFSEISIYDFDPKLPKKATPIAGKAELEEDGSNLSIVLKNIIQDKDKKRKLFNLVKDLLPFVEDLDVEKFADKSLLFKLSEFYFSNKYLPASLISDGTINITALITALYFEKKPLIIIEEPERNIHPHLISRVIEMMKEVSKEKQILVTTHSPEAVKFAGLENILFVARDKNGFSTVFRPANKKEIKIFLENNIGIEELYIQNLLEV